MARILYIVSQQESQFCSQLYGQMRHDMETATVELIHDRRRSERRQRVEPVKAERRLADRRRHHIEEELSRVGWARVEIDSSPDESAAEGAGGPECTGPSLRDST
jgi:hypothetical protein